MSVRNDGSSTCKGFRGSVVLYLPSCIEHGQSRFENSITILLWIGSTLPRIVLVSCKTTSSGYCCDLSNINTTTSSSSSSKNNILLCRQVRQPTTMTDCSDTCDRRRLHDASCVLIVELLQLLVLLLLYFDVSKKRIKIEKKRRRKKRKAAITLTNESAPNCVLIVVVDAVSSSLKKNQCFKALQPQGVYTEQTAADEAAPLTAVAAVTKPFVTVVAPVKFVIICSRLAMWCAGS